MLGPCRSFRVSLKGRGIQRGGIWWLETPNFTLLIIVYNIIANLRLGLVISYTRVSYMIEGDISILGERRTIEV